MKKYIDLHFIRDHFAEWAIDYLRTHTKIMPNGCIEVIRADQNQYGSVAMYLAGRRIRLPLHRIAWALFVSPPPRNMMIDHLCRNTKCCFVGHLRLATPRENVLSGKTIVAKNAKKTHCPYGHEYTPENILLKGRINKHRYCRICWNQRQVNYYRTGQFRLPKPEC